MPNQPTYHQALKPENYLELWKYFTDDAAKIKDRLWTIASIFFAAITGLISFIASNLLTLTRKNILDKEIILITVTSIAFFGLCAYFKYLITQYGRHIRSGWNRADFIRRRIAGLSEIWFLENSDRLQQDIVMPVETAMPEEAARLISIANIIAIGYLIFLGAIYAVILL